MAVPLIVADQDVVVPSVVRALPELPVWLGTTYPAAVVALAAADVALVAAAVALAAALVALVAAAVALAAAEVAEVAAAVWLVKADEADVAALLA